MKHEAKQVKTSASKLLWVAVNVSVWGTACSSLWIQRVWGSPVRMLRIRMTEQQGNWLAEVYLVNGH